MPGPDVIETLGLQDPSVNEFLAHPDFRQVAAFVLGWVFISSLSCILFSSIFQNFLQRIISGLFTTSGNISPDPETPSEKSPSIWTASAQGSRLFTKGDNHTLVFTLCICLAFASVAYFSSLLSFDPSNGAAACAFVVAWGGMAAQSARLVGLLILSFELRQLGIGRWESIVFWIWLGVGIVFVFVTNAISTGTTKVVQQLDVSLCYRRHFLPTSLVSSLIYFFLELYVVVRLALLIAPTFMQLRHRLGAMTDVRVLRGLSLVLLELLTIIPAATFTGVLGEFIPFSIGSLAVLTAFNHHNPGAVELRVTSIPPSINSSFPSRRSAALKVHSLVLPVAIPPPDPPSPYQAPYRQSIPNHPFAATSLNDPTLQVDRWQRRPWSALSSESIDSATANSIRGVVIETASRGSRALLTRLPLGVSASPMSMKNTPSSEPLDTGENMNLVSVRPRKPQQILPDQVKYAERFEHKSPKKSAPPPIFNNINSPVLQSWPSADPITDRSLRSPSSVVYGSDIIRVARQSCATNTTRRSSHSGAATGGLRHSYLTSSPRETLISSPSRSSRRYSWASPNEELPVLYEASIKGTLGTDVASKPRPPTFGEQSFQDASILAPPPRTSIGLPSCPRTGPGGPRIRGPRPPPPFTALQADRRYSTPTLPPDNRRRRSSTLTTERGPTADKV